jgi:type I restriction enzyme, S subunit
VSLFDQIAQQHYAAPPEGWQSKKIKFLADIQTSNVDKLTVDDEEPVRLCNYTDVYYNDRITPDLSFMEATATPKEIEKFTLQAGQVFITKDSEGWDDIGIPALVTEDMPGVLCGYHLAIFTPDSDKLDGAFLAWLCRADALNDQFKLSANGVTRFGLGQYPMKNAVVGYPPLGTQKRIAAFLDEKTAQIDALIARKQALLARLAEKRQATITQAVTKGLNHAAPLKDSGIDWLGQIPAHWEVKRLKFVGETILGLTYSPFDVVNEGEGKLVLRSSNVQNGKIAWGDNVFVQTDVPEELIVQSGDILICSRNGSRALIGKNAVITDEYAGQTFGAFMTVYRTPMYRFIHLVLNSELFTFQSGRFMTSTINQLTIYAIKDFAIPVPPADEQQKIADAVHFMLEQLDRVAGDVKTSIGKLVEYRSALITSAVTGQIEGLR